MTTIIMMPVEYTTAINRLAELIGAAREWERAALVALLVRPGKGGRPSRSANKTDQQQFSIAEFAAKGIYGLTSVKSAAYLRAWKISGLPVPEFGQKIELPAIDFPPFEQLYQQQNNRRKVYVTIVCPKCGHEFET